MHSQQQDPLDRGPNSRARGMICIALAVTALAAPSLDGLLRLNPICWGSHERPSCLTAGRG